MVRITYTPAQKAEAIRLLNKGRKAEEVIEKIGCSLASLQNWKKEYKEGKIRLSDQSKGNSDNKGGDDASSCSAPPFQKPVCKISLDDFVKKYWRSKSVDTVMNMPESIDEVVALVNSALKYAYTELDG